MHQFRIRINKKCWALGGKIEKCMSMHSGSMCLETNINILKSQINDPQASTFIYFLIN